MDMYYMFINSIRNPVIHDRNSKDFKFILNYEVDSRIVPKTDENGEKITKSHLIGMRNAVLIISKFGIHKQWVTVDDYINTIKALQPMLNCPKSLDKLIKRDNKWIFDYDNIHESLLWNSKLINSGVKYLINSKGKK